MSFFLFAILTPAHAGSASAGTWNTAERDSTPWEIYADSVLDYTSNYGNHVNGLGNLVNTKPEIDAYIAQMIPVGYTTYLHYWDSPAYSADYEYAANDNTYNDAGDYNLFSGHGGSGTFYLNGSSGNNVVTASETHWGDRDAEVVAIDACYALDSAGRTAFATYNINQGVHFILGFQSTASDITTTGDMFGFYLKNGYTVASSWIYGTMAGHDSTHTGAYVRFYNSSCNTYNDTASTVSCDPQSASSYVSVSWTL